MNILKLHPEFIEEFSRTITLKEEEGKDPYELKIQLKQNCQKGIHIDLPKIKAAANYLERNHNIVHLPKDCDAIILDPTNKLLYLIEMKSTTETATDEEVLQQLNAGLSWWNHISFCMDNEIHFEVIKIAAYVNNSVSRSRRVSREKGLSSAPSSPHFIKKLGKSIKLDTV